MCRKPTMFGLSNSIKLTLITQVFRLYLLWFCEQPRFCPSVLTEIIAVQACRHMISLTPTYLTPSWLVAYLRFSGTFHMDQSPFTSNHTTLWGPPLLFSSPTRVLCFIDWGQSAARRVQSGIAGSWLNSSSEFNKFGDRSSSEHQGTTLNDKV